MIFYKRKSMKMDINEPETQKHSYEKNVFKLMKFTSNLTFLITHDRNFVLMIFIKKSSKKDKNYLLFELQILSMEDENEREFEEKERE